ncbi:MAG TPA: VWA domain-containing protein [Bacteroidia bacterium]|nr:VWA domain-containing protein [Bacteroidia bacterium]
MSKRVKLLFILLGIQQLVAGQSVNGKISINDSVHLSVISIAPNEFPSINVLFSAANKEGNPVWGIQKENVHVKEDQLEGEVISLTPVTKNVPLNIGIVLDHSGSMASEIDFARENFVESAPTSMGPIDHAKAAVISFMQNFDFTKDAMSVTGFSDSPDIKMELSQDTAKLSALIKSIEPSASTALFDGMASGIYQIKQGKGIKVLVVLTDGNDNASRINRDSLVRLANAENIPIYLIGLGYVNSGLLQSIADETNGNYFHADSSSSLTAIYQAISREILSCYALTYKSPNLTSDPTDRDVVISFDTEESQELLMTGKLKLPKEVVAYIQSQSYSRSVMLYGGIILALAMGAGVIVYNYRKNKNKLTINKIYPNPTQGEITIDYTGEAITVHVTDLFGNKKLTFPISPDQKTFNLESLQPDEYIIILEGVAERSNGVGVRRG